MFRRLGRIDDVLGVDNWNTALDWLAAAREPIEEIQYWGHGKWGRAFVRDDSFDIESLDRYRPQLEAIRERLAPDALVWFRTCETLGAHAGHDFAQRLSDFLGARIAGHTFVIGYHQSGLHGLRPGTRPHWSADEGLAKGTAAAPERARWSFPWRPHTITLWTPSVPDAWFGG